MAIELKKILVLDGTDRNLKIDTIINELKEISSKEEVSGCSVVLKNRDSERFYKNWIDFFTEENGYNNVLYTKLKENGFIKNVISYETTEENIIFDKEIKGELFRYINPFFDDLKNEFIKLFKELDKSHLKNKYGAFKLFESKGDQSVCFNRNKKGYGAQLDQSPLLLMLKYFLYNNQILAKECFNNCHNLINDILNGDHHNLFITDTNQNWKEIIGLEVYQEGNQNSHTEIVFDLNNGFIGLLYDTKDEELRIKLRKRIESIIRTELFLTYTDILERERKLNEVCNKVDRQLLEYAIHRNNVEMVIDYFQKNVKPQNVNKDNGEDTQSSNTLDTHNVKNVLKYPIMLLNREIGRENRNKIISLLLEKNIKLFSPTARNKKEDIINLITDIDPKLFAKVIIKESLQSIGVNDKNINELSKDDKESIKKIIYEIITNSIQYDNQLANYKHYSNREQLVFEKLVAIKEDFPEFGELDMLWLFNPELSNKLISNGFDNKDNEKSIANIIKTTISSDRYSATLNDSIINIQTKLEEQGIELTNKNLAYIVKTIDTLSTAYFQNRFKKSCIKSILNILKNKELSITDKIDGNPLWFHMPKLLNYFPDKLQNKIKEEIEENVKNNKSQNYILFSLLNHNILPTIITDQNILCEEDVDGNNVIKALLSPREEKRINKNGYESTTDYCFIELLNRSEPNYGARYTKEIIEEIFIKKHKGITLFEKLLKDTINYNLEEDSTNDNLFGVDKDLFFRSFAKTIKDILKNNYEYYDNKIYNGFTIYEMLTNNITGKGKQNKGQKYTYKKSTEAITNNLLEIMSFAYQESELEEIEEKYIKKVIDNSTILRKQEKHKL